jgi:hypothetical protein
MLISKETIHICDCKTLSIIRCIDSELYVLSVINGTDSHVGVIVASRKDKCAE